MALYNYQAYAKDGKRIKGTLDAPSPEAVKEQLLKSNLYPFSIELVKDQIGFVPWYRRILQGPVSTKDKILFTNQLAVLIKAGVPLLQALELLIEQFTGRMKSILISVKDDVKEGKSFSQGLAKFPKTFDTVYVQLVRAGEASGKLEVILERLVEYIERRAEIVKRVKSALTYPVIQLVVVLLVTVALLTFVIPQMAETFAQQGGQLPGTTRFLMTLSNILRNHYILLLSILIIGILIVRYWKSTPSGALMVDRIKLKTPIVKYFTRMGTIVQFSRTLGLLLESGVNLAEALDIVVKITDNRVLKGALEQARDKIIKQGKIAEFLKQTNIFPPIATYLIKTGEESGQLDFMLLTVAKNYETDLADYADSLTARLQPIMLIVMGLIVGFIVLSIVQPMIQQAQLLGI